jgi:hypothetical protein
MDTKYLHEALRNWQVRNQDSRTWEKLSQAEQSEIMSEAQALKRNEKQPLSIDEVLERRAWYVLQAALAAKASRTMFALVALLALAGCTQKKTDTPAPAPTENTQAGRMAERSLENQELDCEYKLVGRKLSETDARAACESSLRSDWQEWALKYPELAKARGVTR